MKLKFIHNQPQFDSDLREVVTAFYPTIVEGDDNFLKLDADFDGEELKVVLTSDYYKKFKKVYSFEIKAETPLEEKRYLKRHLKVALYRTLCFFTQMGLPYGCLTGVRPTKYYLELGENARDIFLNEFSVSGEKVKLVENVINTQTPYRNKKPLKVVDVFINIPFCPSRCIYCSFISQPILKQQDIVRPYIDCLKKEIIEIKRTVKQKKFSVRAVYVGGGTPTSLKPDELKEILSLLHLGQKEFTVEAGRPDTITKKMIRVMKSAGVNRISINPQTFHQKTLNKIGRAHKVEDVYSAYKLAKRKFIVNMDLIAMLPNETFDDFKESVDKTVELEPDNITVHTLYLKNGSDLKVKGYTCYNMVEATQMVEYAYYKMTTKGYSPYYMYRQKYTIGNLENVGYTRPKKVCIYNIDIMEEDTSIIAGGAGGISKKYSLDKQLIERQANCKEPKDYVERFDEMLQKQINFWRN